MTTVFSSNNGVSPTRIKLVPTGTGSSIASTDTSNPTLHIDGTTGIATFCLAPNPLVAPQDVTVTT